MATKKPKLIKFISEPVDVHFTSPPPYSKKPHCPDQFTWREESFLIAECLAQWTDFTRRGRMAKNMQPQHARVAAQRGSWGVGRYYFDVRTQNGRLFRLYYDRAPADASDREGAWILMAELSNQED